MYLGTGCNLLGPDGHACYKKNLLKKGFLNLSSRAKSFQNMNYLDDFILQCAPKVMVRCCIDTETRKNKNLPYDIHMYIMN